MRFLIIRHGDPDYAKDSLTPKGFREAEALAIRLKKMGINKIYASPLGRARDTAAPTARELGLEPEILPWLTEFPIPIKHDGMNPNPAGHCPWNLFPELWADNNALSNSDWRQFWIYKDSGIAEYYDKVSAELDKLMLYHGYKREGQLYRILPGYSQSNQTVALFCHHGIGCALLAHLCSVSLPLFWHSFFLTTSSVTQVLMEMHHADRKTAVARIISLADTSHLYAANEAVSSSGLHSPIE